MQQCVFRQKTRQRIEKVDYELMKLMLELSEAKRETSSIRQSTARNRTLAALAVAVHESIRAFLAAETHMK